MDRLTLAFEDPELEGDFRRFLARRARARHLAVFGLSGLFTAAMALIDATVLDAARLHTMWRLRYGVLLPGTVAFALLGRLPERTYAALVNVLMFVAMFVALSAVAMLGYAISPMTDSVVQYGAISAVVTLLVFHAVGMARWWSVAVGGVLGSSVIVAVTAAGASSWRPVAFGAFFLTTANVVGTAIGYVFERHQRSDFAQQRVIEAERGKSDRLLRNVLPEAIATRLKEQPGHIADHFDVVTVMFADIVGFTRLSASMAPSALVEMLNDVFTRFDEMARRHGLEKIKTIGDAYMVVGGVPSPRDDHAVAVAELALEMQSAIAALGDGRLAMRIGMHTGPVVAGVIGTSKFSYDLWGDTVNTASRMESHGTPGEIQVSDVCRDALAGRFVLEARGEVDVKGRGLMRTWWLRGLK
jgi:class 3 adenylate cyclase